MHREMISACGPVRKWRKKIFSGFDASLEGEFRTRDGLQTVERWSGSAGVSYKMFRWLKASAGYTFIHYYHPMEVTKKGNYIPEYWQPKHRVNLSLTGKVDWRRFTFSLRERWQYTYRPSQSVPKFDGDDGSVKNDEYISGKGKMCFVPVFRWNIIYVNVLLRLILHV